MATELHLVDLESWKGEGDFDSERVEHARQFVNSG